VPNEFLEAYFPLRIERYETVADSGGAGAFRGGNGIEIAYRFLETGEISIHDDRWFTYPWGVNGGKPGARSRKLMVRKDGSKEILPSKCDRVKVKPGDLLHYVTWGGGGWGDPLTRDPALVAKEVGRGLVTRDGAKAYGVVLNPTGAVDETATKKLRASMSKKRGKVEIFDFGGSIEALRKRAKKETGLSAPKEPTFQFPVAAE